MHNSEYDQMIPLLGGFHTLFVYKKYGYLGLQDWCVDAGASANRSVMQSIE